MSTETKTTKSRLFPVLAFLLLVYAATHLFHLGSLVIFADESIYIRWAQLILDDPSRYAFFALNDGKTPLYIWGLVPWLSVITNQLLAARLWSVLAGAVQVVLSVMLVQKLGGKRTASIMAAVLVSFLPFWFFHHRIALMDAWLTVFLTATLWGLLSLVTAVSEKKSPRQLLRLSFFAGLSWALSLWFKLPAVLAASWFVFTPFSYFLPKTKQLPKALFFTGVAGLTGGMLFATLALAPGFGQLFHRGGDFLYPWQDVVFGGLWKQTLPNIPSYLWYFVSYLTWPVCMLALSGLFSQKRQRLHHWLWLGWLSWLVPIALLGRMVYPRYLLPAAVFLTLSAALSWEEWLEHFTQLHRSFWRQAAHALLLVLFLSQICMSSCLFIANAWWNPNAIPFVSADRVQYLTEWSSGHGIAESASLIEKQLPSTRLAVATEGFFGTLPDALLVYFYNRPVENLVLEGIGQPVGSIPASFWEKAAQSDQVWLVVNSHRLKMELPSSDRLLSVCRPFGAPCLQVWDITSLRPKK